MSASVRGGVNMVQLREKDLSGRALLELGTRLKEALGPKTTLIVNERVDVALACGADGVQLGEEGLSVSAARNLVGADMLIGRSVHSLDAAVSAEAEGADYLVVGTIFATGSHPGVRPSGVALLSDVAREVSVPFLAIGGINVQNVSQVMDAGASGAAVISAILGVDRPDDAASAMARQIREAWSRTVAPGRSE